MNRSVLGKIRKWGLPLLGVALLLLAACSDGGASPEGPEADPVQEPVTLTVFQWGLAALGENDFNRMFADPVRAKLPHITLESVTGSTPQERLVAGSLPDILFFGSPNFTEYTALGALTDLSGLITKYNVNMDRFEAAGMNTIRAYSSDGIVTALPFSRNFAGLFYNKDIFDKLGAGYPVDGMTWDEAIELGRQVTRTVDGVSYSGLHSAGAQLIGGQLSLPLVDPSTNKAQIDTEGYKRVFELLSRMYAYDHDKSIGFNPNRNRLFLTDRTLAMFQDWGLGMFTQLSALDAEMSLNWDVVQLPYFPDAPNVEHNPDLHVLAISNTSRHIEAAFHAIDYLTAKEVQIITSRAGRATPLTDTEVRNVFGADLLYAEGKNLQGMFKSRPSDFVPTLYDKVVTPHITKAANEILTGQKDINTALREAQEAADQEIRALLAR